MLKNEERIILAKSEIEQIINELTVGLSTLDQKESKSEERDMLLAKKKFKLAEKRFKNSE